MAHKKNKVISAFKKYFDQWPEIENVSFFVSEYSLNDQDISVNGQHFDSLAKNAAKDCDELISNIIDIINEHIRQKSIYAGDSFFSKLEECKQQLNSAKEYFDQIFQNNTEIKMCHIFINDEVIKDPKTYIEYTSKVPWKYVDKLEIYIDRDGIVETTEHPKCRY